MSEKKVLNTINNSKDKIRFPIKGRIKTNAQKINVLIQAQLGNIEVMDWGLKQDVLQVNNHFFSFIDSKDLFRWASFGNFLGSYFTNETELLYCPSKCSCFVFDPFHLSL